jgi:hypothetical protein
MGLPNNPPLSLRDSSGISRSISREVRGDANATSFSTINIQAKKTTLPYNFSNFYDLDTIFWNPGSGVITSTLVFFASPSVRRTSFVINTVFSAGRPFVESKSFIVSTRLTISAVNVVALTTNFFYNISIGFRNTTNTQFLSDNSFFYGFSPPTDGNITMISNGLGATMTSTIDTTYTITTALATANKIGIEMNIRPADSSLIGTATNLRLFGRFQLLSIYPASGNVYPVSYGTTDYTFHSM